MTKAKAGNKKDFEWKSWSGVKDEDASIECGITSVEAEIGGVLLKDFPRRQRFDVKCCGGRILRQCRLESVSGRESAENPRNPSKMSTVLTFEAVTPDGLRIVVTKDILFRLSGKKAWPAKLVEAQRETDEYHARRLSRSRGRGAC